MNMHLDSIVTQKWTCKTPDAQQHAQMLLRLAEVHLNKGGKLEYLKKYFHSETKIDSNQYEIHGNGLGLKKGYNGGEMWRDMVLQL